MAILIAWLSSALGLWVASRVLSGVRLASFADALWAGALLGALNWALYKFLFVLLGIFTLGLGFLFAFITSWVASALVILLAAALSSRLEVRGFLPAVITALLVSAAERLVIWLV
jgi:uncharacterized membrane protein YvlD (DUF360 family)